MLWIDRALRRCTDLHPFQNALGAASGLAQQRAQFVLKRPELFPNEIQRSRDVWRRRLMAEFAGLERSSSRSRFRWAWIPASAALLAAASVQVWLGMPGRSVPARISVQSEDIASAGLVDTDEDNGFIPVPYALPLATGESVRIVRRELNGAELVRMGIDLPGAYAADLSDDFEADVVVGEDELPRAVQLVSYPDL